MAWYDVFATFYDRSLERLYAPYRQQAVAALAPSPDAVVLDLACGTGQGLEALAPAVPQGTVIGVDRSAGMLRRAEARVARRGWPNVRLLQRDARELDAAALHDALGREAPLDGALVALGLSVIPDWEAVLDRTWSLLRPGGRLAIFDVHADRWVPQTWMVQLLARADLSRKPWEHLGAGGAAVEHTWLAGSPHKHGGRPFLAVATR